MNVCANDCIGGHIDLSNLPWIHSLQHNQPTADTSTTLYTKTQTYVTTGTTTCKRSPRLSKKCMTGRQHSWTPTTAKSAR